MRNPFNDGAFRAIFMALFYSEGFILIAIHPDSRFGMLGTAILITSLLTVATAVLVWGWGKK